MQPEAAQSKIAVEEARASVPEIPVVEAVVSEASVKDVSEADASSEEATDGGHKGE